MRKTSTIWVTLTAIFCLLACTKEEETYPSIINEFADLLTDANGRLDSFRLDNDTKYNILNKEDGYHKNAIYRVLCGFTPREGRNAALYSLIGVHLLRDSTNAPLTHPTDIQSAWRAGRYINMMLSPKTQNGTQYWGYIVDSITSHCAYLSLYHNQNNDPRSFSTTTYASVPVDSIKGIEKGDSIILRVYTFNGTRSWTFRK